MSRIPEDFVLRARETAALGPMAPRRRSEFERGRCAARHALSQLGLSDAAVPVGEHREPVWPEGIVGSLTHDAGIAIAAVASCRSIALLGIDLARSGVVDAELWPVLCRTPERARLEASATPRRDATALFSAKESVYKCIWPQLRRWIDFRDVEIEWDEPRRRFTVASCAAHLPRDLFARLRGCLCERDGMIVTAAWIRQTSASPAVDYSRTAVPRSP